MTLIKPGFGISALSGKIGGQVYARNLGGMYVRNLGSPTQPDSPDQLEKWQIWTDCGEAYKSLSHAELNIWSEYADSLTRTNRFGDPMKLTSQTIFTECYTNATLAGLTPLTLPSNFSNRPAITDAGDLEPTTIFGTIQKLQINGVRVICPSGHTGVVLFYAAPSQRPSVRNVNNQFRLIGAYAPNPVLIEYTREYRDKFGEEALVGWLAHLRMRVIDGESMLGSTRVLRNAPFTE